VSKVLINFMDGLGWSGREGALTQLFLLVSDRIVKKPKGTAKNANTGKYYHPVARESIPDKRICFNAEV
jgi:hypothetical protein